MVAAAGLQWLHASDDAKPAAAPTYSRDVAPIVQRNCQVCHRPGEAGPFPMLNYKQVRPWAQAMKVAVESGKMPPWFADPRYGSFSNAMSLSAAEKETLEKWADAGAPEGDPKDLPPPVDWVEGWGIGKPDKIYELPVPFDVPASGVVDYQHVIVPTGFTEDTWVTAAEVRPTDRMVVHHIIAFVREPRSNWFRGQKPGVFFTAPQVKTEEQPDTSALPSDFLVGYAPGQPAEILRPAKPSLLRPVRISSSRCTTLRMAMPAKTSRSSALSLPKSRPKSVFLLCPLPMARSRSLLEPRTTAWTPTLRLAAT